MKTIAVTKRSRRLSQLLAEAQRNSLILRASNGAEFILAEINDFDREIELQRQSPDLMEFLDRRGSQRPTKSTADVRKGLRLPRPR